MGLFRNCGGRSIGAWMPSSSFCPALPRRTDASSTTPETRHSRGSSFAGGDSVSDSTIHDDVVPPAASGVTAPNRSTAGESTTPDPRSPLSHVVPFRDLNDRLVGELIDAVKTILRKET